MNAVELTSSSVRGRQTRLNKERERERERERGGGGGGGGGEEQMSALIARFKYLLCVLTHARSKTF